MSRSSRSLEDVSSVPRSRTGRCHLVEFVYQSYAGERKICDQLGYDDWFDRTLVHSWLVVQIILALCRILTVICLIQSPSLVCSVMSLLCASAQSGWLGCASCLHVSICMVTFVFFLRFKLWWLIRSTLPSYQWNYTGSSTPYLACGFVHSFADYPASWVVLFFCGQPGEFWRFHTAS